MVLGILALLVVTNILTLIWGLRRQPVSNKVKAIQRAIAAFEIEGHSILHISKINPDEVYLRSPER